MSGMNRVFLMGNIGADPELRFSQGGMAVLNIRLATNETYLDKDKNKKEDVQWHNVVVFGKRAEGLGKFLAKGHYIHVEGKIKYSTYEKDGEKRYKTDIIATDIIVPPNGKKDGAPREHASTPPADGPPDQAGFSDYGDDIPY